jgi:hypothetical protein
VIPLTEGNEKERDNMMHVPDLSKARLSAPASFAIQNPPRQQKQIDESELPDQRQKLQQHAHSLYLLQHEQLQEHLLQHQQLFQHQVELLKSESGFPVHVLGQITRKLTL